MGDENFYKTIRDFGFGQLTNIELPAENHGMLHPLDKWTPNSIGSVDTQTILDGCYTGVNPQFCGDIAPRAAQQQLSTVTAIDENLGVTKTSGIDIGGNYVYVLPGYGSITLSDDFTLLLTYLQQNVPNGPFINFAGLLTPSNDSSGQPLRLRYPARHRRRGNRL